MRKLNILKNHIDNLKDFQEQIEEEDGYLLEFNIEGNEATLAGNSAGLLHFVCRIMDLFDKYEGAHVHLDEDSDFPEGSNKITIEWKKE